MIHSVPNAILANATDAIELLNDIKKLTVEDVVVMYAYSEAIVETIREPLIILDGDLRIKTANKSFFETFKVTKNQTYNELIFNLGNGQWNIPELKKLLRKILIKNSHFNDFEVHHVFNDIGKKTMILNARRIVLEGNKTQLILLAIEDITKQSEYQKKLHKSEQHYRWIVEQVKDHIIYTMDKEGLITDWNAAAEVITGYKKEEVIGKFHSLLYTKEDQEEDIPAKEIKRAEHKGMEATEQWHVRKDKSIFWGSGIVTALYDEKENLRGFSKVMRDITVQKEEAKLKDEFLSIASHELKTPITSIKAYTQLLKKRLAGSNDTKNAHFLTRIDSQTNKLTTLINDFLDISKIEAGKLVLTNKKFDLNALIDKIVVDHQYITEMHQIKKVGKLKKIITGDEGRIGQVIINLLTNAIKYSPNRKEVIINVSEDKTGVTVSVQDFGMGIPKRKQKYIFDKYFQVTENGDEGKKGFGLGLYISTQIIQGHHGKLWVDSTKGKGSTFTFSLPYQK